MSLQKELGFPQPIEQAAHEAVLGLVLTGSLLAKEGSRVLRPFGLTDSQFNVLMILKYQSKDGRLNQAGLGRMLLVNRSNVTGLVDRMEQAGLVRRVVEPEDRRVNQVELTAEGALALERASQAYFERLEEVMSGLSPEQYHELSGMLEKVRRNLHRRRG
jgi:DNA-binding MarR family transcriptional regulator